MFAIFAGPPKDHRIFTLTCHKDFRLFCIVSDGGPLFFEPLHQDCLRSGFKGLN